MTLAAVLQPIRDELPASPCRYLLELIINMKAAKAIDQSPAISGVQESCGNLDKKQAAGC
jgi:hypothetical protein